MGPWTYGGPHTTHRTRPLPEEQIAVDEGDICAAKQREVAVDLFAQNGDRMPYTGLARHGGTVQNWPSRENAFRPQSQGFEHIGAAADAAIHHHHCAPGRLDNSGEDAQRGDRAVGLAPALI